MRNLGFVITSTVAISMMPHLASAQAGDPNVDPCVVSPTTPSGGSLSEQLSNCSGVLAPPKIGDSEIVEPAPESGAIRIVPPSAVPEQSSDVIDGPEPAASGEAAYDIGEIVDAITRSATTARSLSMLQNPEVKVRDISILLTGSNAAVLNASLMEHAGALETLRSAISKNQALASAVADAGLHVQGIVAAQIADEKSVTLFGR